MILAFIQVFSTILLIIFLGAFSLVAIALIRTIAIKNPKIKVLERNSLSSEKIDDYQRNMKVLFEKELIAALKELFPTICSKGEFVSFNNSFIFIYKNGKSESNILVNTPIKKMDPNEIRFNGIVGYGENTFNSKSELYSIFDALETIVLGGGDLKIDIYIAIYQKDQGMKDITKYLEKKKFNLTIGEGGKILDPITTGFRSFYAFLGVGVNEKITIRYKTKKIGRGFERIEDFIGEIKEASLFETKIDKEAVQAIRNLSKEMLYGNRFILNNIAWLPRLGKRIVEEELLESNKAWKTYFKCGEIGSDEEYYYVDIDFYLSSSETEEDIITALNKRVIKYSLDFQIISKREKSRNINTHSLLYKDIVNIIENSFQELYITSYIINEEINDFDIDRISENTIRFTPLYYSRDAIIGEKTNNECVSLASIDKAINFYEEFFLQVGRKQ